MTEVLLIGGPKDGHRVETEPTREVLQFLDTSHIDTSVNPRDCEPLVISESHKIHHYKMLCLNGCPSNLWIGVHESLSFNDAPNKFLGDIK